MQVNKTNLQRDAAPQVRKSHGRLRGFNLTALTLIKRITYLYNITMMMMIQQNQHLAVAV
jgi:hypothetical protein